MKTRVLLGVSAAALLGLALSIVLTVTAIGRAQTPAQKTLGRTTPAPAPTPARTGSLELDVRLLGALSGSDENDDDEPDAVFAKPPFRAGPQGVTGTGATSSAAAAGGGRPTDSNQQTGGGGGSSGGSTPLSSHPNAAKWIDQALQKLRGSEVNVALLGSHKYMINDCLGIKVSAGTFQMRLAEPKIYFQGTALIFECGIDKLSFSAIKLRMRPNPNVLKLCKFSKKFEVGGSADDVRLKLKMDPIVDLANCRFYSSVLPEATVRIGDLNLKPLQNNLDKMAKNAVEDALTAFLNFQFYDQITRVFDDMIEADCPGGTIRRGVENTIAGVGLIVGGTAANVRGAVETINTLMLAGAVPAELLVDATSPAAVRKWVENLNAALLAGALPAQLLVEATSPAAVRKAIETINTLMFAGAVPAQLLVEATSPAAVRRWIENLNAVLLAGTAPGELVSTGFDSVFGGGGRGGAGGTSGAGGTDVAALAQRVQQLEGRVAALEQRPAGAGGTPAPKGKAASTTAPSPTAVTAPTPATARPPVASKAGAQNIPGVRMPTIHEGDPCCNVVANPELKGRLGRIVVAYPAGAAFKSSSPRTDIFKAGDPKSLRTDYGNLAVEMTPGTYDLTIGGQKIPGVVVEARSDTLVKVGVLQLNASGSTRFDLFPGGGKPALQTLYGQSVVGLPPGTYEVQVNGQREVVTVRAGGITEY